jgi:hypothetical protein
VDAIDFWRQVRRRRNRFFLWWFGWPVVGMAVAIGYESIVKVEAPNWLMVGLFGAWFVAWVLLQRRLAELRCPRCDRPAMGHPYFFMRHARCRHCGLSYVAA